MTSILAMAGENLLSPIILSFVLGLFAAFGRSDLSIPEAIAKGMSLYLLFAIGFKGGAGLAIHGLDLRLAAALLTGMLLSLTLPLLAFVLLRYLAPVSVIDAAAVAGHYGSISIVTFLAASSLLTERGISAESYMVAVAAAMEAPAIVAALWLATRGRESVRRPDATLWRDVLLNGSIVLLIGAFAIGWITGPSGLALGMSTGGVALMAVLCASASYIAVPAAMRVALPEANPALSLTLSLGVTFPFNLVLGIPLYLTLSELIART